MKYEIQEIPAEYLDKAKIKLSKSWTLEDLNLQDPALFIDWPEERWSGLTPLNGDMSNPSVCLDMINDPDFDLNRQLAEVERKLEFMTAGDGFCNIPSLNLLHFGTGPLATAFGAVPVYRKGHVVAFEPAVHSPEEANALVKPNLEKDGMCRLVLERIDLYNEVTKGKIPIVTCDTGGPWSIATQIWHYEDMLEAIITHPEIVHSFMSLVTKCMIEFIHIQNSRIHNHFCPYEQTGNIWRPYGWYLADDTMVAVSPKTYKEFFMPCNERISKAFGGVVYHCCMKHEHQFENMAATRGFMGFDADPAYNDIGLIEKNLAGKGAWGRIIENVDYIKRLKGKAGMFIRVRGKNRRDALENVKRLMWDIGD